MSGLDICAVLVRHKVGFIGERQVANIFGGHIDHGLHGWCSQYLETEWWKCQVETFGMVRITFSRSESALARAD